MDGDGEDDGLDAKTMFDKLLVSLPEDLKCMLLMKALEMCGPSCLEGFEAARDAIIFNASRQEPSLLRAIGTWLNEEGFEGEKEEEEEEEDEEGDVDDGDGDHGGENDDEGHFEEVAIGGGEVTKGIHDGESVFSWVDGRGAVSSSSASSTARQSEQSSSLTSSSASLSSASVVAAVAASATEGQLNASDTIQTISNTVNGSSATPARVDSEEMDMAK